MPTLSKIKAPTAVSDVNAPLIVSLYKGKITIKFFNTNGRHSYFVNGKRCKSVTGAHGILDKSRALIPWAVGESLDFLEQYVGQKLTIDMLYEADGKHEEKKAAAANIGTTTHEWIERFVKGEKPDMPDNKNVLQAVNGFLKWVEEHHVKFVASEKLVYSKKHEYVGTMDAIATMGGHRGQFLIDYKVSSGLYPTVAYQTAAYLKADQEESGAEYAGRWAIKLSKESEGEYIAKQEKKLAKWLRKNPGKDPYEISTYQPFEAKFLPMTTVDRDFDIHLLCMKLGEAHSAVDKEFFPGKGW